MSIKLAIKLFVLVSLPVFVSAQGLVFSGIPRVKVSEGGLERTAEIVSKKNAKDLRCAIREESGRYFWVTRGDKEMLRKVSGSFITYFAIDGAGYVRIVDPSAKEMASLMSPTESEYDYVEHMLIGLRSVTYYGVVD